MESASGMEVGPQSSLKLEPWGLVSRFGESYRQRLIKDPGLATRLEGACRTISYVIAGRFQASNELSELAYSVSNLLVLIHDGILHKPSQYQTAQFLSHRKLRSWLTVIGYLEVVVEMGAGRAGGDHARWLLITAIEITKLVLRSLLLLWYKIGILPSPPIALHKNSKPSGVSRRCSSSHCFLGKRSKRLVRCLDETSLAPHQFCGVSPYEEGEEEELGDHEDNSDDTMPLDRLQTLAESLHIVRPLIHLFIMARLGQRSWTPWVMSAALDISSLCLIRNPGVLGCRQRAELRRRTLVLLLYLLRSPCYDRFSEAKILFVLRILADNIPGLSLIISPLMEYLPAWQKVYFYLWD